MYTNITDSRRANLGARVIRQAYENFQTRLTDITRRAKDRFERCEFHNIQADATAKLSIYKEEVGLAATEIQYLLGSRVQEKLLWVSIKAVYSSWISERNDWEIGETFFNSVTRKIFATVGVDPQIEFVDTDFKTPPTSSLQRNYCSYTQIGSLTELISMILSDYPFQVAYEDINRDVQLVVDKLTATIQEQGLSEPITQVDMLTPLFYRGRAAYLIGRIIIGEQLIPLALALDNRPQRGIIIDTILLDENRISILFSFAHSYFRVFTYRPYDLVHFLASLMPRKKLAELYISVGYNKHGKTELYRHLIHHLAQTDDQFHLSKGEKGMVMIVFDMPSYEVVFKIIRDNFAYPKDSTRREVMEKYRMVFKHDRAGRLVDAQSFEHLKFDRSKFSEALLTELKNEATQTVAVEDDYVIIYHAYVERRLTPLNLYIDMVDTEAAKAAVIDYGQAIKDLMATNIFPGDLLLKNFGVTRHGRVVFYDYDELCWLTDCKFRRIPRSRSYEDEMSAEPWFSINDNDVFPEQFPSFLGLDGELREAFLAHHHDLFEPKTWREVQKRIKQGNLIRVYPYNQDIRFKQ